MSYKLSNKAEQDLRAIYRYTFNSFGHAQADAYLTGLEELLIELSNTPKLAQKVDNIRTNYRRYPPLIRSMRYISSKKRHSSMSCVFCINK